MRKPFVRQSSDQDVEFFGEAVGGVVRVVAPEGVFKARNAAAHAYLEPPAAEVDEHRDLFDEADGMVEGEAVDERAEMDPFGALGRGGEEDVLRWGHAQRGLVVLREVITPKAEPVGERQQFEPLAV